MKSKLLHEAGGEKTWALIFEKDDELMAGLQRFAEEQKLSGSHFTGIGACNDVTLGFFDREKNDYKRIPVAEQVEVLTLAGDIALEGEKPKIHAHVVLGRRDGKALGGHVIEAHVWPTLEVILVESPAHLRRRSDPETGLALISVKTE